MRIFSVLIVKNSSEACFDTACSQFRNVLMCARMGELGDVVIDQKCNLSSRTRMDRAKYMYARNCRKSGDCCNADKVSLRRGKFKQRTICYVIRRKKVARVLQNFGKVCCHSMYFNLNITY